MAHLRTISLPLEALVEGPEARQKETASVQHLQVQRTVVRARKATVECCAGSQWKCDMAGSAEGNLAYSCTSVKEECRRNGDAVAQPARRTVVLDARSVALPRPL